MTISDLDKYMYQFIAAFAFADGDPVCKILKGYQNYVAALDKSSIIFVRIGAQGREEGLRLFATNPLTRDDGTLTSANLRFHTYQIMSTGVNVEMVPQRLDRLIEAFNSAIGSLWFRKNTNDRYGGAAPIRTGQIMDQTTEGDVGAYEFTYTCDFTVAARMQISIPQDWAEHIDPNIVQVVK